MYKHNVTTYTMYVIYRKHKKDEQTTRKKKENKK